MKPLDYKKAVAAFLIALIVPGVAGTVDSVSVSPSGEKIVQKGTAVIVEGEAEGEDLEKLRLLKSEQDSNIYSTEKTKNCNSSPCTVSKSFISNSKNTLNFKTEAVSSTEERESNANTVKWRKSHIESVNISPESDKEVETGSSIKIEGGAEGFGINKIRLLKNSDGNFYTTEKTSDCGGNSCSIDKSFISNSEKTVNFKIEVEPDKGETKESVVRQVTWNQPKSIESVEISPENDKTIETGGAVKIRGDASGENLDKIKIFKRDNSGWEKERTKSCSGSSCSISKSFISNSENNLDFKVRARSGTDTRTSEIRTITWKKEETDQKNPVASLSATPDPAETGEFVRFDARSSYDPDGSIDEYWFDLNNNGFYEIKDNTKGYVSRSFGTVGTRTARVKVFDDEGSSRTASTNFRIREAVSECDIRANNLQVADRVEADSSTDAEITVQNRMNYGQKVRVKFRADGDTVDIDSGTINARSEHRFSAEIKSDYDDDSDGKVSVTAEVVTRGDQCGNRNIASRSSQILVAEPDKGRLSVIVKDMDGDRLEDAHVEVENGGSETRDTDSRGEADFWLEPGDYGVEVSKPGYRTDSKRVIIEKNERDVLVFRLREEEEEEQGLVITDVDHPDSVCRGGSFTADVTVRNRDGFHEFVTVTGNGFDRSIIGPRFSLGRGKTVTKSIRFTNVEGSGSTDFTVDVRNHDDDSETRSIDVKNCGVPRTEAATGIQMQVDSQRVRAGQYVKVTGYVDGVSRSREVRIRLGGREAGTALTQPDGFFQVFIRPEEVGKQFLTATVDGVSSSTEIQVLPTTTVSGVRAKDKVFQGESLQVCGDVSSQVAPRVYLTDNGEVIDSKNARGEVCFETSSTETGTHRYGIRAATYGSVSGGSTTVEVLETAPETTSFPSQVASVESGSGLVKVELYNTHDSARRYHLSLEGLPDDWISQTDREAVLQKGERKTVYFYLTPKKEGEYRATVSVEAGGSSIYRDPVRVYAGGTDKPQRKSLFQRLIGVFH